MPTCLEQGVNLSYDLMYYVMFPKGTDPAICQKFAQAFKEISEMPEYAEEIKTAYNQTPYFLDTEESIAYIQEENEKMMAMRLLQVISIDQRPHSGRSGW